MCFTSPSRERDDKVNLDAIRVQSFAPLVGNDTIFLRAARFEYEACDEGVVCENLRCTLQSGAEVAFLVFSGCAQGRVIMEFAIAQMASVASVAPALLIVERPNLGIDEARFALYFEYFASSECLFQTVITQLDHTDDIKGLGSQINQLTGATGTTPPTVMSTLPTAPDATA